MLKKPDWLYHGSCQFKTLLYPAQATGLSAADNYMGIYATEREELAIVFAMSFVATGKDALFSVNTQTSPPEIWLKDTRVDWNQPGYIYQLNSDAFEPIAPYQWLARAAVQPVSYRVIDPQQYQSWIKQA